MLHNRQHFMLGSNINIGQMALATGAAGNGGEGTPLSPEPTVQASNLVLSAVTDTTATATWTVGNGNKSMVLAVEGETAYTPPSDSTTYTANAEFGSGDTTSTGCFVMYAGTGNTFDVTGLSASTEYTFYVVTYNDTLGAGTENYLTLPGVSDTITTGAPVRGFTALKEYNVTSTSSLTIDWSDEDTDHDWFEVYQVGVEMSVDGASVRVRTTVSGSPQTGADYPFHVMDPESGASSYVGAANAASTYTAGLLLIGSAAGENGSGLISFPNPTSTSLYKNIHSRHTGVHDDGSTKMSNLGSTWENTSAIDGVQLYPSSGTFSGKFILVGRSNP